MEIICNDLEGLCLSFQPYLDIALQRVTLHIVLVATTVVNPNMHQRTVNIDQQARPVRFFGMKGDLKWLAHVFKLPQPHVCVYMYIYICISL